MTRSALFASACALLAVIAAAVFILPGEHGDGRSAHTGHGGSNASTPREAGQGAFGALSEIVSIISADPGTDWSKVDIDALRRHLVDMKEVTLNAQVEEDTGPESLRYTVTGNLRTAAAIKRMVPAHAAFMKDSSTARFDTEVIENGVILTLANLSDAERTKYNALGFFGFMATGAHHQPHHLAMAKGGPVHAH